MNSLGNNYVERDSVCKPRYLGSILGNISKYMGRCQVNIPLFFIRDEFIWVIKSKGIVCANPGIWEDVENIIESTGGSPTKKGKRPLNGKGGV